MKKSRGSGKTGTGDGGRVVRGRVVKPMVTTRNPLKPVTNIFELMKSRKLKVFEPPLKKTPPAISILKNQEVTTGADVLAVSSKQDIR